MKLTTIETNGRKYLAEVKEDGVYLFESELCMNDLLEKDDLSCLNGIPQKKAEDFQYVNLLETDKIICVGYNYPKHSKGMKVDLPTTPVLFSKYRDALAPYGATVEMIPQEDTYDYEGELVIVIGKAGYQIPKEEVLDHIFGYTVGNDVSVRGAQFRTSQYLIGKALPNGGPCGPCIVTKDSYDYKNQVIQAWVNGEKRQEGNTSEMIFNVEDIVSFASTYFPLNPGDLIFTGTPSGVAKELPEKGYLKDGDVVEIEISGIGRLRNTMKQR